MKYYIQRENDIIVNLIKKKTMEHLGFRPIYLFDIWKELLIEDGRSIYQLRTRLMM